MWGSWTTGAWVCPPGGALTVATRFDMQLSVEAHRNSSRIVFDMKIRRPGEKMDVWWGLKQEWGLFWDEHAGLTSGGDEQRLWWEESLRYCDRNKRGCVYLMPEKSDRKTVLYFSRDGWKQRPMFFDDGSDDTSCERNAERLESETEERRRRPKRRWWNDEDGVGGGVGDDLSDEVKAGGSRPPVEWSSPGRWWAFFIFF